MAKINILPAKVYNRIAAGEVIDRPYSVVKELVENAIDAGATEIEIYIEQGGKQLIRVIDNGCGIARDDLHSAFLPHATSKIAVAEDLDSVLTLGFRGEAVASIAAVSNMTITSKTEDGECYQLTSRGGELGNIQQVAGEKGTDVVVECLFFNTPVRLKFLKSNKAEETDITTVVSRFILNRPNIAFTYYADEKKILQSFGGGLEEAIVGVYGASILQNCYHIRAEKHGIMMEGYIGNQNFSKPNKSYQSVFLNGRYILNATIAASISSAYNSYLMKRQYPFYVLYLRIPTEIVDVNVHPNKSDVRFADNQMIFGCIHSVIAAVLDGQPKGLEYIVPSAYSTTLPADSATEDCSKNEQSSGRVNLQETAETRENEGRAPVETESGAIQSEGDAAGETTEATQSAPSLTESGFQPSLLEEGDNRSMSYQDAEQVLRFARTRVVPKDKIKDVPYGEVVMVELEDGELAPYYSAKGSFLYSELKPYTGKLVSEDELKRKKRPYNGEGRQTEKLHKKFPYLPFERFYIEFGDSEEGNAENTPEAYEVKGATDTFAENKRYLEQLETRNSQTRIDVADCRFVGKLFNTYLMFERADEVFIIDQHAAHERLIFDRLKEQMERREVIQQPMLIPFELKTNAFEGAFIREHFDEIREIGFEITEGESNQFLVHAVPVDLQSIKLNDFFNEILGDINGLRSIKLTDILKDKLAMAACKAAVKGGMDLTQDEIDRLFLMIDGNMGLKCPHGRPVVTKLTKTELEKMFKRKL